MTKFTAQELFNKAENCRGVGSFDHAQVLMLQALFVQQQEMAEFYEQERRLSLGPAARLREDSQANRHLRDGQEGSGPVYRPPTPRPSDSQDPPADPSGVARPRASGGKVICENCGEILVRLQGQHAWTHRHNNSIACTAPREEPKQMAQPILGTPREATLTKCRNCGAEITVKKGTHRFFWVHSSNQLVPCLSIAG